MAVGMSRRGLGLVALLALLLGGALGWGAHTILRPPEPLPSEPEYLLAEAQRTTVGNSLGLSARATWRSTPQGTNRAAGTVTRGVLEPGGKVSSGQIVYFVDEEPVTVVQGKVPAYRDLQAPMRGEDVRQLEQFLHDNGMEWLKVDDRYTTDTAKAVRRWQKKVGLEPTGVVRLRDIIFVPETEFRGTLAEGIKVGANLAGGETALSVVDGEPKFTMGLENMQMSMFDVGSTVLLSSPHGDWEAEIANIIEGENGPQANLVALGGGSICGEECGALSLTDPNVLSARIVLVPDTEGVGVPSAALSTRADGAAFVMGADGEELPVTIVAASGGTTVVDGIEEGTKVRVRADG